MDIHAMNRLYGTNPIFIYDPVNKTNRPVKGYQDNVIIYWDVYPQIIRDLFTKSFTDGLTYPNKRVTEKQWLDAFANLITGIMTCPDCGAEVFFDERKVAAGIAHSCWNCGRLIQHPVSIIIGKNQNAKLYSHSIYGDYDMDTVVGEVVQNPNNPSLWGIKNESKDNWTYIRPDGQQIPVAVGRSAAIAKDAKIGFGQLIGEFK